MTATDHFAAIYAGLKTAEQYARELQDRAVAAESALEAATETLRQIEQQQEQTLGWIKAHGIVFDGPLGTDPLNWENVAFSIYTDLVEACHHARSFLARTAGGKEQT